MSALVALAVLGGCSSDDGGPSAAPDQPDRPDAPAIDVDISGPVTGGARGEPANRMLPEVAARYGYVEEEYFLSGEATAFAPVGELGADGRWTVEPAGTAPYTTRVLVRRPEDPDDFNGTAVVEWFNVSSGMDGDPDFGLLHPLLLDEGYAHVAVSAQAAGVGDGDGDGAELDLPEGAPQGPIQPLKQRDPERYGELSHPGDEYSYDIVTQVGRLARNGELLDGQAADHVILTGESQSAFRITTYIDAVQPEARAYDGFLVHSRNGSGAPLSGDGAMGSVEGLRIRTDLDSPVLQFQTESDLVGLGALPARQPDTDGIVTWEVAGTAHADADLAEYAQSAIGVSFDVSSICGAINDGPQAEALRAAFVALSRWVVDGTAPPTAPPLETTGETLARDEHGIALGGVRTPAVDAPTAVHSGENDTDNEVCALFGSTVPFTPEQLARLYPTHQDYVDAVTESADAAVDAGFLLPDDRDSIVADAEAAAIPR